MGSWAEPAGDRVDRRELAAHIRAKAADLAERIGAPASQIKLERAAALERGEAVRVASWELPRDMSRGLGTAWFVIAADGRLREPTRDDELHGPLGPLSGGAS